MEDFVAEIYYYAQLIPAIKEIVENCYSDELIFFKRNWEDIQDILIEFCRMTEKNRPGLGQKIYGNFQNACENTVNGNNNHNAMADILNETIPLMYEAMELMGTIDVTEGDYRIHSSKSGFLILSNNADNRIYHSTLDPMYEAMIRAKKVFYPRKVSYCFLGCGLGYLPWQLFCISNQSADIYIYHNNPQVVEYAIKYGVLSWIPEEKLHIIIEKDYYKLLDDYSDSHPERGECGYITMNDVTDSLNEQGKFAISRFVALNKTAYLFSGIVDTNFWRNVKNIKKTLADFETPHKSEEWLVVVAGPSLDSKLEYVKSCEGTKNIICASTVLKKLINYGIHPDCVAVLDPQNRTYGHFDGLEDYSTPLLLSSTGNWQFGEYYQGDKYIVPSLTSEASNSYFLTKKKKILYIGSTVASMGIQIALEKGAKTIELVGLDLAYPTGKSHAEGTMDLKAMDTSGMVPVKCVAGGKVLTTEQFKIYIAEVEEIISQHKDVKFINHSDVGAEFAGSIWYRNL